MLDNEFTVFKIRRHFGNIKNAADHFQVRPALIYMIANGERGQNSVNSKSKKIFNELIDRGLVVFKE